MSFEKDKFWGKISYESKIYINTTFTSSFISLYLYLYLYSSPPWKKYINLVNQVILR
jgi:hypothetical protein